MNVDYLDLCKVLYVLKSNQVQDTFYNNFILEWILENYSESASYNGSRLSLIVLCIPHRLHPPLDKMGITHFHSSRSCARLLAVPIGCPCSCWVT